MFVVMDVSLKAHVRRPRRAQAVAKAILYQPLLNATRISHRTPLIMFKLRRQMTTHPTLSSLISAMLELFCKIYISSSPINLITLRANYCGSSLSIDNDIRTHIEIISLRKYQKT